MTGQCMIPSSNHSLEDPVFLQQEKGSQIADVILLLSFLSVFLFHRPESGRGSEKMLPMFVQYSPECSGIRGVTGFPHKEWCCSTVNQ